MFDDEHSEFAKDGINWVAVGFTILLVVVILGSGLTFVALKAQHDVVNPQLRQNKIDDPDTTIANKSDFHNKLGLIIKADQDVITDLNLLSKYSKTDANYDTALNNLTGVEQIRSQAINSYNAKADNPDTGKDLDSWMPKHVDVKLLPADDQQTIAYLNQEIVQLDAAYNHA